MKIVKVGITAILGIVVIGCVFFVKLHKINGDIPSYAIAGDGSLHVYLLNLDKSTDRLASIKPLIESLGYPYTRIPAVYGKELSQEYRDSVTNPTKYKLLMHNEIGAGTIGCYLSHINIWKKFLQSKHSYALIFEDDVEFEPNKLRKLIDLLMLQSQEWDLVNIDVNRHGFAKPVMQLSGLFRLVKFRVRVGNTSCYLINRKAAIELVKRALPISMPVDHYMMRPWEFGIKIRGVTPQIVHQSFGDSEIKKQDTQRSNVPFFYKITSFFYQITADAMTMFCACKFR